jgi:phosphoglycolate phosphatase
MSSPFTLALFDLDGVLVDSALPMARAVDAALAAVGAGPAPAEMQRLLFGPPLYVGFAALLEAMGADPLLHKHCAGVYREHYQEYVISESRIFDGMRRVLEQLLGVTPMVVATSKPKQFAEPLMKSLGVDGYFVGIAAPESESQAEPKSATISRALERHSPGKRPVHVGDTTEDVRAARANGVPCAAVLWGFGAEQELRAADPAWLVSTPGDLASLLLFTPR